jgi:predicted DCC family thiol-disulfide oxidoreductase YuxK
MPLENAAGKPVFFYDGDCGLCRYWTNYWRKLTLDRVEYRSYEQTESSSKFIETDGQTFHGAAGVAHLLSYAHGKGWVLWLYKHLPAFRMIAEMAYRRVASCRHCAAHLTRWFWGERLEPSIYFFTRKLFLRCLGAIYVLVFISFGLQIPGLIGQDGILPAGEFLQGVQNQFGVWSVMKVPTLAWISADASFLQFLAFIGAGLGLLALIGLQLTPIFFLLWALYLSMFYAGQVFMGFPWDTFLLEAGFLAIFFAPTRLGSNGNPSGIIVWLYRFLIFRLMFGLGFGKLDYHYFTQPIPNPISWFAHQLPIWVDHTSVLFLLVIQLILPFFIFAPRRLRFFAAFCFIFLELFIAITGNFSFFNVLTIILMVLLFDDQFFRRTSHTPLINRKIPKWTPRVLAALIVILFLFQEPTSLKLVNSYDVFTAMITQRNEIVMEGSMDGKSWRAYEFKYKPGDPSRRPSFVAPYQPRLDWQMWIAALSTYESTPWFVQFSQKLLQGSKDVLALLESDPFVGVPPKYVRASLYEYQFTNYDERRQTGNWWKREGRGLYLPVTQLKQ